MRGDITIILMASAIALASAGLTACGHDNPPERDASGMRPGSGGSSGNGDGQGSNTGMGQRPGIGEKNDFDSELTDDTWRVKVPGASLRYDRGGVLFTTLADGSVSVRDLDGADEIEIALGTEQADSTLSDASVTVNGAELSLSEIKMMRRCEGRIWYRVTDSSDGRWVMVIPTG